MLRLREKFLLILSLSDNSVLFRVADDAKAIVGQSKLDSGSRKFGAFVTTNIPPLGRAWLLE
jgi:hypothetical protein